MDDEDAKQVAALQDEIARLRNELSTSKAMACDDQVELKLAIFNKIPMPIWACDRDCKIVYWNDAAARLYGYSSEVAIGADFVELFVNEAERAKARVDCREIIDCDKAIRNMADDVDRHGTTRKLVTQCFALYNISGHSGLQVEISYEVQDIDRLRDELSDLQDAYNKEVRQKDELVKLLVRSTRESAVTALERVVGVEGDRINARESEILKLHAQGKMAASSIDEIRSELALQMKKLHAWSANMRKKIHEDMSVDDLENVKIDVESRVGLND